MGRITPFPPPPFSFNEANPAAYPYRPAYHRWRETISVKDTGARGTGSADDDYAAFAEAFSYAQTRGSSQVNVPSHEPGAYYRVATPLSITKALRVVGQHPLVTIAAAGTMATSAYMIDIDGTAIPSLEQVHLENLTIRPYLGSGTRGRGVNVNRVGNFSMTRVIIYTPHIGITFTGDRGFGSTIKQCQVYQSAAEGHYISSFTGGGQHYWEQFNFNGCAVGRRLDAASLISDVTEMNCGFEVCTQAAEYLGNIEGWYNICGYSESNTVVGGGTYRFIPSSGKTQRTIVFDKGRHHTSAEAWLAILGGAGNLYGATFNNLHATGYSTSLIRKSGAGTTDRVAAIRNYLGTTAAVVNNGPFTTQTLDGNYNDSGAVAA